MYRFGSGKKNVKHSPRHWEYEANNIFRGIVLINLNNGPIAQKIWHFANSGILLKLLIQFLIDKSLFPTSLFHE